MKNKNLILNIFLFVLSFTSGFLISRSVVNFDYRKISTDSGFDSSFDSGSSSSDSSWSSSDGSSSGSGSSVASEEIAVFKEYFPNGFNFKDYFKYIGSLPYFIILAEELFFHAFIGIFIYAFIISDKKKFKKYELISTGLYIIFPNVLFFLIEFFGFFVFAFKNSKKNNDINYGATSQEINLEEYNIDKEKIHKEIYDIYVRIQEAWSSFELEKVRDVISDEIFNMYESQLATLKTKQEQNVMSDFEYINCRITKIIENSDNNTKTIKSELEVKCKDYIINTKNNKVTRGNKKRINTYLYRLTFIESNKTDVERCPNCNAILKEKGKTVKCSYCGTLINRKSSNLVMIKKEMIKQR